MSRSLASNIVKVKNLLYDDGAFVWALKVKTQKYDTARYWYFCRNNTAMTISSKTYEPLNFEISGFQENSDGKIADLSLAIADPMGVLHTWVRENDLAEAEITVMLVYTGTNLSPTNPDVVITEVYKILSWTSKIKAITFKLGERSLMAQRMPNRRIFRETCTFKFKDDYCGYGSGSTGAGADVGHNSCDYSYDGPNGCTMKGNQKRFGGFLSVPFGRGQR